jgi:hypothetical protein
MEETIKLIGDRYSDGLPYIEDVKFTESNETAIHRLKCTERCLEKTDMMDEYVEKIAEYTKKRGKSKKKSENLAVGDIVELHLEKRV